jgi:hypothetical protein
MTFHSYMLVYHRVNGHVGLNMFHSPTGWPALTSFNCLTWHDLGQVHGACQQRGQIFAVFAAVKSQFLGLRFHIDFNKVIWDFIYPRLSRLTPTAPSKMEGFPWESAWEIEPQSWMVHWFMLLQCRRSFRTQNKLIFFEIPGCVAFGRGDS